MAVIIRYVDERGWVIERFLGIAHVSETTSATLKATIDKLFSKHNLSISKLRGQGYDGASNMQGELKGLKTLILNENKSAYYVYYFAHQLQLALVAVAKNQSQITSFFNMVTSASNIVGGSCKRQDILHHEQAVKVIEELETNERQSGRGLNQEANFKRPGDTRWGSHYGTLVSLIDMFSSIVKVFDIVVIYGSNSYQKGEAGRIFESMQSFEFVLMLFLVKNIFTFTNELSKALQRNDQDIINAMDLVKVAKEKLQKMRDNGWDSLLKEVTAHCSKHKISAPILSDEFVPKGRLWPYANISTNEQYYRSELFSNCLDHQLMELK